MKRVLRGQHLHDVDWRPRQRCRGPVGTRRKNLRVIAEQRHLACARLASQLAELEHEFTLTHRRQPPRYLPGSKQVVALLDLEDGTDYFDGVAEAGLDIDVEPRINTSIDVLDREIEDDNQRQHGETDEHAHDAGFKPRPRDVFTIVAQQPDQVADEKYEQQDRAGDVPDDQDVVQPIEILRVLRGHAEQEQRAQRQQHASRREQADECSL